MLYGKIMRSVAMLGILILQGSLCAAASSASSSSVTKNADKKLRKAIFKKTRAAQISQNVEQLQTAFEDEDGLIQEYDAQMGDVSRLLEYESIFKDVPGYDRHKEIILRNGAVKRLSDKTKIQRDGHVGCARGSRFELEVAFDLHCAQKTIEQFGPVYGGKEFDIQIPGTLIECKDIKWSIQKNNRLRTFLLEHKVIAERYNKKFKFYSRRFIPDPWKAWLNENGIEFKDTLDVASRDSNREYEQGLSSSSVSSSSSASGYSASLLSRL